MKMTFYKFTRGKKYFVRMLLMLAFVFGIAGVHSASAQLSITPVTWNVIGLDSNNVSVGPNLFPVGARVCNRGGSAVNNVVARFIWDTINVNVALDTGASDMQTQTTLSAGACIDFYFDVVITRTPAAYNSTRRYRITAAADGVSLVSTPTPREVFVEKLVSQNRNTVVSVDGPSTVFVGGTYTYTVNASTATGGYEQLEAFLSLSNVVFRVTNIATTYTAPTGATNDKFYADACGWDNNPLNVATYRSCIGPAQYSGGKTGNSIRTVYTVRVLSTGTTTASTLVYDFSGSSYHYNSDYGQKVISITSLPLPVPNVGLIKSISPAGAQMPGTELTYSIAFSNSGTAGAASLVLTDPNLPSGIRLNTNTDFKVGSVVNSLGSTGLAATVTYSNNNGTTFAYTPVSGGGGAPAGFDRNVTHIRWAFTGSLSQTTPNNTGSISFVVRIR